MTSLLEQLEKTANERRAQAAGAAEHKDAMDLRFQKQIAPAMGECFHYLQKLAQTLNTLKPPRTQAYEIPGYGKAIAALNYDYKVAQNVQPQSVEIILTTSVQMSAASPQIDVQGAAKIKALNATFQGLQLSGLVTAQKDAAVDANKATYKARGKVVMRAEIFAEASNPQVRLTLQNFDGFGGTSKMYNAEQFNADLFDRIARYVAREDQSLLREEVPDNLKKHLAHQIAQENMKRKWEERLAVQSRDEEEKKAVEESLSARLKKKAEGLLGALFKRGSKENS
jgi:hypothetical protein